jgi:hypothetical protein
MKYAALALMLACAACGTAGDLVHSPDYRKRETLRTSLLKDDKALLTDEAIQKLLSSRIQLPEKAKLAVFPVSQITGRTEEDWRATVTSPVEFLQARKANLDALEAPLLATGRFVEITHVPSLIAPPELSITRLRETAALMQADLLLLYETRAELLTYYGTLFTKDAVKAYVSIEVLLLDVRTGVLPYAETFEAIHEIKASGADWNMPDLQRRAQIEGTQEVLRTAAAGLATFFAKRD